jgi:hypothetical protein
MSLKTICHSCGWLSIVLAFCSQAQTADGPGAGVAIKPGDDVQRAVNSHPPGATFFLKPGVHRLQSVTPKSGDSFIGGAGAVMNGSTLLTSFQHEAREWVADSPVHTPAATRGSCMPYAPACALVEDLFLDDIPLQRVANRSAVGPGKWYADYASGHIYLGDDPASHRVEISTAEHAFYGSADNVTIRGLVIEKYAGTGGQGAIHAKLNPGPLSHGWVIEDNEIRLNHGIGVRVGHGTHVVHNKIHNNGQLGMGGDGRDVQVVGNEIAYNNYAGFSMDWEAGGAKFHATENLVVRDNEVHNNLGPGLHTDGDNHNALFDHNHTSSNRIAGIHHEISYDAVIRNNTVENEGSSPFGSGPEYGAGIAITASSNVEVYGNTVINCASGIVVKNPSRGANATGEPYLLKNVYVHDNAITQRSGIAAGIFRGRGVDSAVFTSWNNRFENNIFNLEDPNGKHFAWGDSILSKAEWNSRVSGR